MENKVKGGVTARDVIDQWNSIVSYHRKRNRYSIEEDIVDDFRDYIKSIEKHVERERSDRDDIKIIENG
jgi:hypothetical protein